MRKGLPIMTNLIMIQFCRSPQLYRLEHLLCPAMVLVCFPVSSVLLSYVSSSFQQNTPKASAEVGDWLFANVSHLNIEEHVAAKQSHPFGRCWRNKRIITLF